MSTAAATKAWPPPPLTGWRLLLGSVALSTATFMNVLDVSIANVSIPAIAGDLGVSPNQGTWVITSYAVASAICLPLTGWLAQRFGPVRVFMTSVFMFTLASLLCGIAPNIGALIAFRIVQGAVAGPMVPLSQSLLLSSFPQSKGPAALTIWTMTSLIAPVVGPVLGGWITDNASWPWIFYINLPIGILVCVLVWFLYASREAPTVSKPIDLVGLAVLVVWVGSLQLMLDKGKELDWFESTEIITLAVIAATGCVFFVIWELTDKHPVVDLTLFRRRTFWAATLTISLGYGAFFANVVLIPLWLQQHMGYTPTLAGLATAPIGLLALVVSPWVGKNMARYDARRFATFGFITFAVVVFMRSQFNTDASFEVLLWPTLLQGVAMGTFFTPLFSLALQGLPPDRIPSASGLLNFARITTGAFGASLSTTMWERRATLHHARISERLDLRNGLASGLVDQAPDGSGLAVMNRLLDQQAFMMAADEIFYACGVLFLILIVVVWAARPERRAAPPPAGADGGAH